MERFTGLIGYILILCLAFALSNNRRRISVRVVLSGLALQLALAVFILKTTAGQFIFGWTGDKIKSLLDIANQGGEFVFGGLVRPELLRPVFGEQYSFLFMFRIMPTIIFVAVLVNIAYHTGIMQRLISFIALMFHRLMRVSGSEALSNIASAFVGQVEAQILVRPYLSSMTMSELLASMSGSMACIAGGVMAVYISMGIPASYLLAASIMAAPASLVISKIVWPETEESATRQAVKLEVRKVHANLIDAVAHGASDGLKVSLNVIAMLLAFIALIALANAVFIKIGAGLAHTGLNFTAIGINLHHFTIESILGLLFSGFAWVMGVPWREAQTVGMLLGTKMVANEFVAFAGFSPMVAKQLLSPKAVIITSFALCGFANFGSIAVQVAGIGELAPDRRKDLARLGIKALVCGTLASYLSACVAGILM